MKQKRETCSQTTKQWWYETRILPSKLSKLMIPRACSLHTLKTIICEPSLTTQGLENSPAQPGGGTNDENMPNTQKKTKKVSPPPHLYFVYITRLKSFPTGMLC